MGFLDHSTNNIIVDAVLTAAGRAKLAAGNLDISSYTFYDTEVDYTIIKKYGVVVGKEKIEKNTPILEASTGLNTNQSGLFNDIDGNGQVDISIGSNFSSSISGNGNINIPINISGSTSVTIKASYDTSIFTVAYAEQTTSDGTVTFVFSQIKNVLWTTATITFTRTDSGSSISQTLTKSFN